MSSEAMGHETERRETLFLQLDSKYGAEAERRKAEQ
jgi:hypothetical protein